MASFRPLVLEGIDLAGVIEHVLDKHTAPSTIVVCCSKDAFSRQLQAALTHEAVAPENAEQVAPRSKLLARPTLRLLASSRTINLVFCPELAHLRAYLATYAYQITEPIVSGVPPPNSPAPHRILAVLNPIHAHKPTSAYSAQGINRTFATAVDAAYHTQSQLVLAECPSQDDSARLEDLLASEDTTTTIARQTDISSWDEAVSILNVTTKSFGAGERGWVGRTVTIRRIAERWCRFVDLAGAEMS